MSVVVVSLHERDAPLELLERVAISDKELPKTLALLSDSPQLSEVVLLSTCMRTEVYAVADRFHDGLADIAAFFEQMSGSTSTSLNEQLVVAYDDAAARHLFQVAAGLDSAVLGEGEILRQVRHAADRAREEHVLGPVLEALFRHAIEVGKRARTETAIARGITSLAHLSVALVLEHFDHSLAGRRALVVGAGEMGEGIAAALAQAPGMPEIVVANRTKERAQAAATMYDRRVVGLEAASAELAEVDVLFSATSSDAVLFDRATVDAAMRERAGRELVIVDAAVPRDVEPEVGELEGVRLIDVDDLRQFADTELVARRGEVGSVEAIIDEELDRYRLLTRGRVVAPIVSAMHARAEELRRGELERASARVSRLDADGQALIDDISRRIVAKLLHEPTVQLKAAAGSARGERLSEALRTLFDL